MPLLLRGRYVGELGADMVVEVEKRVGGTSGLAEIFIRFLRMTYKSL